MRSSWAVGVGVSAAALAACSSARAQPGQVEAGAEAITADLREAGARFDQGRYGDALEVVEGLAERLGAARPRYPLIEVVRGRCLARLGRTEEALAAYDQALAWATRSVDPMRTTHTRAATLRAELMGELAVECGPLVRQVRLVGRGEAVDCPARWPEVLAGEVRLEPVDVDGAPGRPARVEVVAGAVSTATVEADPNARWRLGGRVGGGAASLLGETVYVDEPGWDSSFRAAVTVESPRVVRWLSGLVELGVSRSAFTYIDTGAVDGRVIAELAPQETGLTVWLLEAVLAARGCVPSDGFTVCMSGGGGVAALLDTENTIDGVDYPLETGRDQAHLLVWGGLEAQWDWQGWTFVAGPHVAYNPGPGFVQYSDDHHASVRLWLDVGVSVCLEPVCW